MKRLFTVKTRIICFAFLACLLGTLASACSQSCPEQPACETHEIHTCSNISLSNLDHASRERLKAEVLSEIHDDLRSQWQNEWRKQQLTLNQTPPKSNNNSEDTQTAQHPPRKSRPTINLPPTQPVEKDDRGLKVMRQTFSTEISRRLPVDERDSFSVEDASVFCFVEISSNDEAERLITLKFIHSTGLSQSFELPVGQSPAWRTWSKLNLTQAMTGSWLCEVFNEDGVLLASKPFYVE